MRHALMTRSPASSNGRIIFLGEDRAFLESLAQAIRQECRWSICVITGKTADALREIDRGKPFLIALDLPIQSQPWLNLISRVKQRHTQVKALILCPATDPNHAARAFRAGFDGCVLRHANVADIVQALRDVFAGRLYVSEEIITAIPKTSR
jgi:DNA-binding NarL/FixJ family response regulator